MTDPVLPTMNDVNRPFWDGAANGELRFQRCSACGHLRYPIAPICPRCLGPDAAWELVAGRGEVLSYVVFHKAYNASRADAMPYAVALVQIDDGPRMFSDLPVGDEVEVAVGDAVEVWFDRAAEVTVPRFRRVRA